MRNTYNQYITRETEKARNYNDNANMRNILYMSYKIQT